ncbi:hypothetical protein J7E70_31165 [Variovorax paradoxus]|nr:hypothetical protein [Variovorax paradoxus]MBT2304880.1 hypothetical protein [Variovorax paradoxus]
MSAHKHHAAPLAIGQSTSVCVPSASRYVSTGVVLKRGAKYVITADKSHWQDWKLDSDADGRDKPTFAQSAVQWALRCKSGRWFQLIGAVGRNNEHLFPVGKHLQWTYEGQGSSRDEVLHLFANDAWFAYWNNHGEINVTITRVA